MDRTCEIITNTCKHSFLFQMISAPDITQSRDKNQPTISTSLERKVVISEVGCLKKTKTKLATNNSAHRADGRALSPSLISGGYKADLTPESPLPGTQASIAIPKQSSEINGVKDAANYHEEMNLPLHRRTSSEEMQSSSEHFADDTSSCEDIHEGSSNMSVKESTENFVSNSSEEDACGELESITLVCETELVRVAPLQSILLENSLPQSSRVLNVGGQSSSNHHIVENICSKFCYRQCSNFVSTLEEEQRKVMSEHFRGPKKLDIKTKLLEHIKSQAVLGKDSSSYTYWSHSFCVAAFSKVTGISKYLLVKVLTDFRDGVQRYIHGSSETPRRSLAQLNFISWMISYSELHGQADPEKMTTVLPAFLNKAALFKIYQAEAPQPQLKSSSFYNLMRKAFGVNRVDKSLPHIRISKYSSHSKVSLDLYLII